MIVFLASSRRSRDRLVFFVFHFTCVRSPSFLAGTSSGLVPRAPKPMIVVQAALRSRLMTLLLVSGLNSIFLVRFGNAWSSGSSVLVFNDLRVDGNTGHQRNSLCCEYMSGVIATLIFPVAANAASLISKRDPSCGAQRGARAHEQAAQVSN